MNGFYNNYNEMILLIKDYEPDLLAIQETHIPFNCNNTVVPKNFTSFFHNLEENSSNKQGIGILIKKHFPHKVIEIFSNLSVIAIEIDIEFKFTLINIYIPPSQKFNKTDILNIFDQIHTPFILCGDVNSWSPFWGSEIENDRGKIFEEIILSKNIIVLNNGNPTHFSTHNTLTNVDISLCSAIISPKCSWEISEQLHGSDHFPIFVNIKSVLNFEKVKCTKKFKTNLANWQFFQKECSKTLDLFPISSNINKESAQIQKIIRSAANVSIPQSNNSLVKGLLPWWSSDLQKLRSEKQNAWHDFKRIRSTANLIIFKKANAVFRKTMKIAKNKSFEELTEKIHPNTPIKKIWSDIKMISGTQVNSTIKYIKHEYLNITSPFEIANLLGTNWSKYSEDTNFSEEFIFQKHQTTSTIYNPKKIPNASKDIESNINLIELENALSSAKGTTPGFDRISYPMLKNLPIDAKTRVLDLYNNIFINGVYPQSWKSAIIVPVPKPNKVATEISGYRPISLLSCLGKILEKIIAKRLSWIIKKRNLISQNQVAFQSKKGTMDVLLHLQHFIANALSNKNHISILATDFEKAFDRIGIHVILQKLSEWNIGKNIYNFVKSFLQNRKFRVSVNGNLSNFFCLHNGIPQGSPLSVVLFIIAFDDLSKILLSFKYIEHSIYADDAIIFSKNSDNQIVQNTFFEIIIKISEWGKTSGAILSIEKCKILHICKKHNCSSISLNINNINIENVQMLKILGIVFDKRYTFKQQCLNLRKQLAARLSIIKYLSSYHSKIHTNTIINVTKSLVLSKIDYCLPIFGWCCKSNLNKIKSPYHNAVRRSLGVFPTSATRNMLAEAGFPSLEDRVQTTTFKLIPKLYNSNNKILHNDVKATISHKKSYSIKSTIRLCCEFAKNIDLNIKPKFIKSAAEPPWKLNSNTFVMDLDSYSKKSTSTHVFAKCFAESMNKYKADGWTPIFTDGSKSNTNTSFAVVHEDGTIISSGRIDNICSVFSAEAHAINLAIKFSAKQKGKFIVCTDSKSTIEAVKKISNNSETITQIRDSCIKNSKKIKIMWIPGHSNIAGNDLADAAAKSASSQSQVNYNVAENIDIAKQIRSKLNTNYLENWVSYTHRYKHFNEFGCPAKYPRNATRRQITLFAKFRIGHTKITHQHLLQGKDAPCCQHCFLPLTPMHILEECCLLTNIRKIIFTEVNPTNLLKICSPENLVLLEKYIDKCNIYKEI